ncbi:MAG: GldG family protein [Verrucomicrobiota bacterium]
MKQQKTFLKASSSAVGALAALAIIVAVNSLLGNFRARLDLTENKLYTLSDGTRRILDELDSRISLKFFFNRTNPDVPIMIKNYAGHVEDLLREYEVVSGGKIKVDMYNPEPDSDDEEWARNYGLHPQQMEIFGSPVYLGVAAISGGEEQVIPALNPAEEELLEYQISRLIHRVSKPKRPVIGVLSSLPALGQDIPPQVATQMQQQPQEKWVTFKDIESDYELAKIDTDTDEIPEDIKTLVLVHPKQLPDETLYAIDQFLLRGGRLMVFVDPLSETDAGTSRSRNPMGMGSDNSSNLEKLFSAWGITFSSGKVVADPRLFTRVQRAGGVEDSLVWLSLREPNLNSGEVITSQLDMLVLPSAGYFEVTDKKEGLEITSLMTSSEDAGVVSPQAAQMGAEMIRNDFERKGSALDLAIRINGTFSTAFPDGPPSPEDDGQQDNEQPEEENNPDKEAAGIQEGESTVILAGDVDMLYDPFCVQETPFGGYQLINDNLHFFANTADLMAGSPALINIRSRGKFERPFTRVLKLEARARGEWQDKEEYLQQQLQKTREQLRDLRTTAESENIILNEKQQKAIERFRNEEQKIQEELREVRKNLRRDIEQLGIKIKIINIGLMPLIVALSGIAFALYRKQKRKRFAG